MATLEAIQYSIFCQSFIILNIDSHGLFSVSKFTNLGYLFFDSRNLSAYTVQTKINIFITTVNLFDIMNNAGTFGA